MDKDASKVIAQCERAGHVCSDEVAIDPIVAIVRQDHPFAGEAIDHQTSYRAVASRDHESADSHLWLPLACIAPIQLDGRVIVEAGLGGPVDGDRLGDVWEGGQGLDSEWWTAADFEGYRVCTRMGIGGVNRFAQAAVGFVAGPVVDVIRCVDDVSGGSICESTTKWRKRKQYDGANRQIPQQKLSEMHCVHFIFLHHEVNERNLNVMVIPMPDTGSSR